MLEVLCPFVCGVLMCLRYMFAAYCVVIAIALDSLLPPLDMLLP